MFKTHLEIKNNKLSIEELDKIFYPAFIQKENFFTKYCESRVNNSIIPKYPKRLPGSIWGITSFFNPVKYSNKYENYKKFRESSKKQGLKLVTVELSFDGEDSFDIQEDEAEILIKINGNERNILWQKEALLNIALKNLPDDCDKLIWIDCDVIFHNDNWLDETSKLLEEYNVIQPFSSMVSLPKDIFNSKDVAYVKWGLGEGRIAHSLARGVSYLGKEQLLGYNYFTCGTIGYAWAIRREIINDIGFFDPMILGGADSIMAYAFYGYDWRGSSTFIPEKLFTKGSEWMNAIANKTNASVFYTEGIIDHLWHGSRENRNYTNRWNPLENFDPEKDIIKNVDGIYEWAEGSEEFMQISNSYFHTREEECDES